MIASKIGISLAKSSFQGFQSQTSGGGFGSLEQKSPVCWKTSVEILTILNAVILNLNLIPKETSNPTPPGAVSIFKRL